MPITNTVSLPILACFSPSKFEGNKKKLLLFEQHHREAGGENII